MNATRHVALVLTTGLALLVANASCGGKRKDDQASAQAQSDALVITAPEIKLERHELAVQQGEFVAVRTTHSTEDGKGAVSKAYWFYLSDGPIIQKAKPAFHAANVPAPDKTLLYIALQGPALTVTRYPFPTGTYPARQPGDPFMQVVALEITPPTANGRKVVVRDFEGSVEITRSEDDEIEGMIDLHKGDLSVRGKFVAKRNSALSEPQ